MSHEVNRTFVVPPGAVSSPPPPASLPPYPGNYPQVYPHPGYQTQVISPYEQDHIVQKLWKEGKALGAIQILIGLMHIGFGIVLVTSLAGGYVSIAFVGGYPFWGGISFITSGSLSVSAQQVPVNRCKISGSLGMNIVSAIFSLVGIILFILELSISGISQPNYDPNYYYTYCAVATGQGISSMLLIFSLLEFVITCISSHSGCRIVCSQPSQVPIVSQAHPVVIHQQVNSPFYSNVVSDQQ